MYSIGEVSKLTSIKVPTIRYYEDSGLIDEPARSMGNQRRYSNQHLDKLSFIKHARDLGFSIAAIRKLLRLAEDDLGDCKEIDLLATSQLLEVKSKIRQLQNLEVELERMLDGCGLGKTTRCYVVESLSDHELCNNNHLSK